MTEQATVNMEKIVSLCQRRGFIFPGSEIYGGLSSCWDYGPLGVELKRNIKEAWWQATVQERDDIVGLDTGILMHPQVWEASGHLKEFSDPLVECKSCHLRWRNDDLVNNRCPSCGGEATVGHNRSDAFRAGKEQSRRSPGREPDDLDILVATYPHEVNRSPHITVIVR